MYFGYCSLGSHPPIRMVWYKLGLPNDDQPLHSRARLLAPNSTLSPKIQCFIIFSTKMWHPQVQLGKPCPVPAIESSSSSCGISAGGSGGGSGLSDSDGFSKMWEKWNWPGRNENSIGFWLEDFGLTTITNQWMDYISLSEILQGSIVFFPVT